MTKKKSVNAKKAHMTIKVLSMPVCIDIINLLDKEDEICVTEIMIRLRMDQGYLSQNLSKLKKAKIVTIRKDGKFIFYK